MKFAAPQKLGTPNVIDASTRLQRVEKLLDQALIDLKGKKNAAPCSRAAALLTEAAHELRAFAMLAAGRLAGPAFLALRPRVQALLPRLRSAERLLAAAAEFYRGWCAVGACCGNSVPGYQTFISFPEPALLAFEG